jgi:hypothetical protein
VPVDEEVYTVILPYILESLRRFCAT